MAFLWKGDATYMYVGLRGVAGNDISVGEIDCTLLSVLVRISCQVVYPNQQLMTSAP